MKENKSNSRIKFAANVIENKLDFVVRNTAVSLLIIGSISLFLRVFYFPYDVPLTQDALEYFFYATDTSILGQLPTNYSFDNNGWPTFLSLFFTIFRFDNAFDYMNLQRVISLSISILTIIPVYFLCNRFFGKPYTLIGTAIFAFEPRLIQNSLLGITEPLYIILITLSLVLFFGSSRIMQYASFGTVAIASLVRNEGLFVFFPLLIMFCVRYRKDRKVVVKCVLSLSIFILVIMPMVIFRIQTLGNDALTTRIIKGVNYYLTTSSHEGGFLTYTILASENFLKFFAWSSIPLYMFFLPIGFFLIFKKRDQENITIIILIISMSLPVFYAFSVAPDTRYIYPLFPLFCILSALTTQELGKKIKHNNLFAIVVIGGILLSSGIFLNFKKYDYEHQIEAFSIAYHVASIAKTINNYYPEDGYLTVAQIPEKWPVLKSSIQFKTSIIPTNGLDSLEKYIKFSKDKGLTHLVIDDHQNRPPFLNDVLYRDEKYPYLIKVFDSWDHGYKYHLKIYKIDYERLDSMIVIEEP